MPDCRFENFDIAVHGQANPYLVRAGYSGYSAEGQLDVDQAQPDWKERIARLASVTHAPGRDFLEETGALLYHALWRDQIRDLWLRARSDIEAGAMDGIRLRLSLSPPDIAALPWEVLYDAERGTYLAAAGQTPAVRVVNLLQYVGSPRPLAARLPLRVLVAIPDDPTGQMDAGYEWHTLNEALAPLHAGGLQLTRLCGRFGLLELRRTIEQQQPHVLHLVTHGRSDGVLFWQDEQPQLAPPAALRLALEQASSLRLVLLAACSTAQVFDQSPLSSLGAQLLQTGVPAVIAMQVDVHAAAAAAFSEHFYLQLLAGPCAGLVDVAVNYARSCLYLREPDQFGFAAPVLWLNAADGRIFTPDRRLVLPMPARARHDSPAAADTATLLDELAVFEGWLAGVPEFERAAVPPELRSVEAGRRKYLQDVRDILARVVGDNQSSERAQRFAEHRPALQARRDDIDRLTILLRANLRKDTGAS